MTRTGITGGVTLGARQYAAILRELAMALDELEALAPLCSIQTRASRAEEAISAAIHLLRTAEQEQPGRSVSPLAASPLQSPRRPHAREGAS